MKKILLGLMLLVSTASFASEFRLVGAYLSKDQKIVVTLQKGSTIKHVSQTKIGVRNPTLGCDVRTCYASKFKQVAEDLYADVTLIESKEVYTEVFIGSFIEGRLLQLDNISVTDDLKIVFDVK